MRSEGQPTVILAKTARATAWVRPARANITDQQEEDDRVRRLRLPGPLRAGADRRAGSRRRPLPPACLTRPQIAYLRERRAGPRGRPACARRGARRSRSTRAEPLGASPTARGTHEREISTTMAFVLASSRASFATSTSASASCSPLPDEVVDAFGMEGMSPRTSASSTRSVKLYRPEGTPNSSCSTGRTRGEQILQEGIDEPGAFSSWIASAHVVLQLDGIQTVPFDIDHSMFGFQRVGDLAGRWRRRRRAASCSAALLGARQCSTARACSTRTAP